MSELHIIDHPLITHKLSIMRNKKTGSKISVNFWRKSRCSWAMS